MGKTPSTAIVIVNYGSAELIALGTRSLEPRGEAVRIVVVDNYRDDESRTHVREAAAQHGWELIENHDNVGFGAAVNVGVAFAIRTGSEVVILANPDLTLTRPAVTALEASVRADPKGAYAPKVLRPDGSIWFDGASVLVGAGRTTMRPGSDSSAPGGWLTGACIALHIDLWSDAGGFDEDYFLYWEDVDLSWKIVATGGFLRVLSDVEVVHDVGGTQDGGGKSPTYVFWNIRNRMLFALRHLDEHAVGVWGRGTFAYARAVVQRGGRRELLSNAAPMLFAAGRGILAARRLVRAHKRGIVPTTGVVDSRTRPVR